MRRLFIALTLFFSAVVVTAAPALYYQHLERASTASLSFARAVESVWFIQTPAGTGSGVLIATDTFVTAAHVVAGLTKVQVKHPKLTGGGLHDADVLYVDLRFDIAILKTHDNLTGPIATQATRSPAPGERVVAVGFPLGLSDVVLTEGFMNGRRDIPYFELGNALITSAAIAPGNSGGALFYQSLSGEWVFAGVAHAILGANYGVQSFPVWHISLFIPVESFDLAIACAVRGVEASCVPPHVGETP